MVVVGGALLCRPWSEKRQARWEKEGTRTVAGRQRPVVGDRSAPYWKEHLGNQEGEQAVSGGACKQSPFVPAGRCRAADVRLLSVRRGNWEWTRTYQIRRYRISRHALTDQLVMIWSSSSAKRIFKARAAFASLPSVKAWVAQTTVPVKGTCTSR